MNRKKHILVVEDERHLAVGIKFNLEAEGYRVTMVGDGPSAIRTMEEVDPPIDLVILDLMLPGMSGYAVCESLRNSGYDTPILILSARTLSEDRTRGFDVGANQYLSKPFDLDELLSRVRNLLTHFGKRRNSDEEPTKSRISQFEFGDAAVDFEKFEASCEGKALQLTKREFELLRYFVENEGRLISRQELLENVWNLPGRVQTRAPDQFLMRLRKHFEPDTQNPRHFLTVRDLGYRFISKPTENDGMSDDEAASG